MSDQDKKKVTAETLAFEIYEVRKLLIQRRNGMKKSMVVYLIATIMCLVGSIALAFLSQIQHEQGTATPASGLSFGSVLFAMFIAFLFLTIAKEVETQANWKQ